MLHLKELQKRQVAFEDEAPGTITEEAPPRSESGTPLTGGWPLRHQLSHPNKVLSLCSCLPAKDAEEVRSWVQLYCGPIKEKAASNA
jgi:hypothetical protein